jgi:uncharacterized protein (TIRG00374 family)
MGGFFSTHKKKIFFILRLFVSIVILLYLVTLFDFGRVAEVTGRLRLSCVWPAPLLVVLGLYFGGIRWSVLLRYFGVRLGMGEGFFCYLIGNFYGSVLPGVIGGDAVRIGICSMSKKRSAIDITVSVLIERICGILALLTVGTAAIVSLPQGLKSALGPAVVMSVPLMAGVLLVVLSGSYVLFGRILPGWFKSRFAGRGGIGETVLRMIDYTNGIPVGGISLVFVLSAVFQVSDILASFSLARAIHIDLPLMFFLAVFPIVYILTVLPISLGGLGVREGVFVYLLTRAGIQASDAVMVSLLIYLNRVLVNSSGAVLQIFWKPEVEGAGAGKQPPKEPEIA